MDDGDIEGFARAILRLAEGPLFAIQMGKRARRFVVDNCTWDGTARQCEAVYYALLNLGQTAIARQAF